MILIQLFLWKKFLLSPQNPIKHIIKNITMFCVNIVYHKFCCGPKHTPLKISKCSTESTEQLRHWMETFREITRFTALLLTICTKFYTQCKLGSCWISKIVVFFLCTGLVWKTCLICHLWPEITNFHIQELFKQSTIMNHMSSDTTKNNCSKVTLSISTTGSNGMLFFSTDLLYLQLFTWIEWMTDRLKKKNNTNSKLTYVTRDKRYLNAQQNFLSLLRVDVCVVCLFVHSIT